MAPAAVGIDVGGTKIAAAVVAADGSTSLYIREPTPREGREDRPAAAPRPSEATADSEPQARASTPTTGAAREERGVGCGPSTATAATTATALVDRLARTAQARGMNIERAGVGVPEYVSPDGRITNALVLPSLQNLPARSPAGVEMLVDSDVRCAAAAEARFGHGRHRDSFLFVVIGTGISSTLVLDGRPWAGHRGEAIALGELRVDPGAALRPDAALTVEQQASGRAIEAAVEAAGPVQGDDPRHTRSVIVTGAAQIIACALRDAVAMLDPAAVIVGGGLGSSRGGFFEALAAHYQELTTSRPQPPDLLQARLGADAGVIGAGLLALAQH